MIWFLLACADPPKPDTAAARPEIVEVNTGMRAEDLNAVQDRMDERLSAMEERIGNLELQVAELRGGYESSAAQISLDPAETTLDGKDVQAAIVELADAVDKLEMAEMGDPSDELFRIPEGQGDQGDQGKGGKGKGQKGPPGPPSGGEGQPPGGQR